MRPVVAYDSDVFDRPNGGQLNKLFPAAAVAAVLALAGCGGESGQVSGASGTAAASATATAVPASQTCGRLLGKGADSPVSAGEALLANLAANKTEQLKSAQNNAKLRAGDIDVAGLHANGELAAIIKDLQKPLLEFAEATDENYIVQTGAYKAASDKLIKFCPEAAATAKATATKTATPTPTTGLKYTLRCRIGTNGDAVTLTDFRTGWAQAFDFCTPETAAGKPSPAEAAAASAAGSTSLDAAKYSYSLCATTAGHYFSGNVSSGQAKEIAAALTLCPDHPKRAELEASAGAGVALESDRANGKLVYSGKYLVGKTAMPGTWQSQGEKVEDCYWEISDAQGNILSNNFINIAPQFTIYVPATAAGFTVRGCGFRWIGE